MPRYETLRLGPHSARERSREPRREAPLAAPCPDGVCVCARGHRRRGVQSAQRGGAAAQRVRRQRTLTAARASVTLDSRAALAPQPRWLATHRARRVVGR